MTAAENLRQIRNRFDEQMTRLTERDVHESMIQNACSIEQVLAIYRVAEQLAAIMDHLKAPSADERVRKAATNLVKWLRKDEAFVTAEAEYATENGLTSKDVEEGLTRKLEEALGL